MAQIISTFETHNLQRAFVRLPSFTSRTFEIVRLNRASVIEVYTIGEDGLPSFEGHEALYAGGILARIFHEAFPA